MRNRKSFILSLLAISVVLVVGCSEDDASPNNELVLNISGLEDLGTTAQYEGWIIVNGQPITTGTFTVDENGNLSQASFDINETDLEDATTFVLTIEPIPDNDPAPSDVHILAGDFNGESAMVTIDHMAALNNDFSNSTGQYILATPTDGSDNNEKSGVWFLNLDSGSPTTGLSLPTLPAGWAYEGWAVIDGQPVSTGTFLEVNQMDDSAIYSGNMSGPPFPGEDFIMNAPSGLSFPTDLSGGMAVISIEPVPDNSPAPFLLKPLVGMIPSNADDHLTYDMAQNLQFPSGSVTR